MVRTRTLILLALVLSSVFLTPVTASSVSGEKSTTVIVPAVKGGNGKLIAINITLIPGGRGRVIIVGAARIGEDTMDSARIAFHTALLLAGLNPYRFDVIVDFGENMERIEGPSASFAVALAIYSLARGDEAPLDGVITGAISPDGLSVMIGGVAQKTRVVCGSNAPRFILPYSNLVMDQKIINSVYASTNCSARLLPARGVLSTYNELRGIEQSYTVVIPSYTREFSSYMEESAHRFIEESTRLGCSLGEAIKMFNQSLEQLGKGRYYTAASLAYTGYIKCLEQHIGGNETLGSLKQQLSILVENISRARERLAEVEKKALSDGAVPLYTLEALATSEARLWMSELYARNALKANSTAEAVSSLSLSLARYETSLLWMDLAEKGFDRSPKINLGILNKTLDAYYAFLNTSMHYLKLMVGEREEPALKSYFDEISDLASRISGVGRENVFLRYGLAGELGYRVIGFLDSINIIDSSSADAYLKEAWLSFTKLYSEALSNGLALQVPAAYAEYASYEGLSPAERLSLLNYAVALTIPMLMYTYGVEHLALGGETVKPGLSRQDLALLLDGWEFIGITSTVIVFLAYYREILKARESSREAS